MGEQEYKASYVTESNMPSALKHSYATSSYTGIVQTIQPSWTSYLPSSTSNSFVVDVGAIKNKNIAKISDVKILSPDKVVQVIFDDGTSEKAVCDKEDTFNLETGITVCIAKKLLGGTKSYNKTIRNALKTMEWNEKSKKEREDEKKRIALKRQKTEEQRRERKVKIQEEAYYRAMKRIESEKKE